MRGPSLRRNLVPAGAASWFHAMGLGVASIIVALLIAAQMIVTKVGDAGPVAHGAHDGHRDGPRQHLPRSVRASGSAARLIPTRRRSRGTSSRRGATREAVR